MLFAAHHSIQSQVLCSRRYWQRESRSEIAAVNPCRTYPRALAACRRISHDSHASCDSHDSHSSHDSRNGPLEIRSAGDAQKSIEIAKKMKMTMKK